MKKRFITLMAAMAIATMAYSSDGLSNLYKNNRQPLLQKDYIELPLGSIKA